MSDMAFDLLRGFGEWHEDQMRSVVTCKVAGQL